MDQETVKVIERLELEFHRRAFGEELARVNFLAPAERRAYVARLRARAARRRIARRLVRPDGPEAQAITAIMEGRKVAIRLVKGIVRGDKASRKTSMPPD